MSNSTWRSASCFAAWEAAARGAASRPPRTVGFNDGASRLTANREGAGEVVNEVTGVGTEEEDELPMDEGREHLAKEKPPCRSTEDPILAASMDDRTPLETACGAGPETAEEESDERGSGTWPVGTWPPPDNLYLFIEPNTQEQRPGLLQFLALRANVWRLAPMIRTGAPRQLNRYTI